MQLLIRNLLIHHRHSPRGGWTELLEGTDQTAIIDSIGRRLDDDAAAKAL
jgi:hypothetical protein